MKLKFVLLLLLSNALPGKSQPPVIDRWKTALIEAIQQEIDLHLKTSCKQSHYHSSIQFFENELQFFAIEQAFVALQVLAESEQLSQTDYFALRLYYPVVGFDPEIGYETDIIIKKKPYDYFQGV